MGYKETVMSDEQIIEVTREAILDEPCSTLPNAIRGIQERAIANRQAELTWPIAEKAGYERGHNDGYGIGLFECKEEAEKAGIQKVVGFVNGNWRDLNFYKLWQDFLGEVEK